MLKRLVHLANRRKHDESGATTVEFMVVMPLIVFWFAGSFTFFDAYSEWTRSVKATYTVADILSRQTEIDDDYIDDMNTLFASIMDESTNDTYLRISSIENNDGDLTIDWSTATGIHPALLNDTEIPTEIFPALIDGESVILIESHMPFIAFQDYVGLANRTLTKKIVISPRFTSKLANTDHP